MASIKCPQCGFVDFATAASCKRCQTPLHKPRSTHPTLEDHSDFDSLGASADNSQKKFYGKVVGGSLIGIGLTLGLATALTQNYLYLPFGGAALLVGAFVVVLLTQPTYSEGWRTSLIAARAGLFSTILGCLYVYWDGLFSPKALDLLLGSGLIVISVIAFRHRT